MKISEFVTAIVVPLVTAITGISVLFLNSSVQKFDGKLKLREADRLESADQRQADQQHIDLRFHIYDAVTKSLESSDARKQQVATALVISMLDQNDSLRTGLLEVLKSQTDHPDVKQKAEKALAETSQFADQQQTVQTAAATSNDDWRSYNLDIFWCAAADYPAKAKDAQAKASQIQQALQKQGSTGRLRVRELGETINASPGYRIDGLVIRREDNEQSVALAIKQIADVALGTQNGFQLTNSRQGTPGYLSLFVCQ